MSRFFRAGSSESESDESEEEEIQRPKLTAPSRWDFFYNKYSSSNILATSVIRSHFAFCRFLSGQSGVTDNTPYHYVAVSALHRFWTIQNGGKMRVS